MWKQFLRWVRSVASAVWPKIEPAVALAVKRYGKEIFDIALTAINIAQQSGGNGESKLNEAKKYIERNLRESGKQIFWDSINFAIESQIPNKTK